MKRICLVLFIAFASSQINFVFSQKDIVYVERFSYTNNIGNSYVEALRNKIIEGMILTDRLNVKDVNSESSLSREADKQTSDASAVDASTMIQMKNLHAKYLIQGHVSTLQTVLKRDDQGKSFYSANVAFDLKIIDVEIGTLKGSKSYSLSGSGSGGLFSSGIGETGEKAFSSLLNTHIETDIKKFINEFFPVEGTILELVEVKKDKATQVYIDLGTTHGVTKGLVFKVYMDREVAGRKSQKEIGEIKVEVVEGEDISLCKVNKGGEEIKTAVGEGQIITIKSINKSGGILGI